MTDTSAESELFASLPEHTPELATVSALGAVGAAIEIQSTPVWWIAASACVMAGIAHIRGRSR